jgi:signal transduction histidine kinase
MFRSTLAKFLLVQLLLLVLFVAAFSWFAFNELSYFLDRGDRQLVERELFRLTVNTGPEVVSRELRSVETTDHRLAPDIFYVLIDDLRDCASRPRPLGDCAKLAPWASPAVRHVALDLKRVADASLPSTSAGMQRLIEFTGRGPYPWSYPWYYISARRVGANSALLVGIDRSVLTRELTSLWARMVLALAAFLVLLVATTTLSIRRVMQAIGRFNASLDQVAGGALAARVPLGKGGFELTVLGRHVNAMLGRIEVMVSSLRRFTDQVAHELRTPLTRLRARLENAEAEGSPVAMRRRINASLADLDVVLSLFNMVLQLARFETDVKLSGKVIDISQIVGDVVELYEPKVAEQGKRLVMNVEPASFIGHEGMVQRLAANVIENAIKYGGDEISVSCGASGAVGFLEISDNGGGLSSAERESMFRLGTRGVVAAGIPGAGLGLYMVSEIARRLGMKIAVDNHPGLRLRFEFPIAKD